MQILTSQKCKKIWHVFVVYFINSLFNIQTNTIRHSNNGKYNIAHLLVNDLKLNFTMQFNSLFFNVGYIFFSRQCLLTSFSILFNIKVYFSKAASWDLLQAPKIVRPQKFCFFKNANSSFLPIIFPLFDIHRFRYTRNFWS